MTTKRPAATKKAAAAKKAVAVETPEATLARRRQRNRVGSKLSFSPRTAIRELSAADPVLGRLIETAPPFRLELAEFHGPFESLLEAIVHQQLNGKVAATILARVHALGRGATVTPEEILAAPDEALRGAGLSGAKAAAMRDLATKTLDGTVPPMAALHDLSDDEIVERLTVVRGVGRWTVQMMLIFRMGRPDVLPVDDYGIRQGFRKVFRKRELPKPKEIAARGERWRPWRSVASWYLWRSLEL